MSTKTIPTGTYLVEAPCPNCGVIEEVLVGLRSVLTTPQDDQASIKVSCKGKARDHNCGQTLIRIGEESDSDDHAAVKDEEGES